MRKPSTDCWVKTMPYLGSCCFLTSTRHRPVHLWDAVTGELRATYRAYDHLDEIVAAHCVAVEPDGAKLFLGCAASLTRLRRLSSALVG